MAPASLVAGLLFVSLIRAAIQLTEKSFKVVATGVMLALTAGMIMMQSMS
jgi:flagellar biosynthesis protein FliQ